MIDNSEDMNEALNNYFLSVFTLKNSRGSTGCIFRRIFLKHTKMTFCTQCVGKGLNCQMETIFSAKFKNQPHQSKI